MIVRNGELAFGWGDLARKSSVASVRKSLINILYGIYAGEGRIDLDATLAGIGIDDVQPLTDTRESESAEDATRRAQVFHEIEEQIAALPGRQREAFLMRYWEDMDVAETAAAMGCSEGSVKTHCSRAVHALSKALKAKGISI